ncbi:hypothetical protein GH811_11950 [Acetobacterium malicum]|uniref:PepSY domain-containing protein n=1 Tax=Acetobacterium malicum TaxID=52692 RepID=A0ABR6YYW6_9FIRM|nr:hypothetical protein [Acetobacterium malicum]MBC3900331.1 hypothetical protein [Acetobacterium malicum]
MKDKKFTRLMMVLIVVLGVLVMVTGCFPNGSDNSKDNDSMATSESEASPIPKIGQDQPFYSFYNKVAINQTKAEVDSALGVEPVMDTDGSYLYYDESTGYSINVFYSAGGLVTTKVLIVVAGGGEWIKLSTATVAESQVPQITEGMNYDQVKNILGGEGLELAAMIYPGTKDKIVYTLVWVNSDFSSLSVTFDGETGKVLFSEYRNAPV